MTATTASVLDWLERLVAFDTESEKSNLPLLALIEDDLRQKGVRFVVTPNALGDKATLFATIGPDAPGGIALSGHTDVVPVEGQPWTSDPFRLRVDGGKAFGRGAVDMKGFCALCLALVPEMQAAALRRPIHLMFSHDEETTCLGVGDTIARFGRDVPRPGVVIVGEPTRLEVADAHKSVFTFDTRVHGHEAHSSRPDAGANAIEGAARLIVELDRLGTELRAAGDPTGRFDPPYATVHVGRIAGGTARNIVPLLCRFEWEVRGVPGTDEVGVAAALAAFADGHVLPKLRATGHPAFVETLHPVAVPGLQPAPGSEAETLALRLTGSNHTVTVPFGTEAGHFQRAGIPTVVCGPGSIEQAHQPDEFIAIEEIDRGLAFLRRLIATCS